jgi:hypothetical protein
MSTLNNVRHHFPRNKKVVFHIKGTDLHKVTEIRLKEHKAKKIGVTWNPNPVLKFIEQTRTCIRFASTPNIAGAKGKVCGGSRTRGPGGDGTLTITVVDPPPVTGPTPTPSSQTVDSSYD